MLFATSSQHPPKHPYVGESDYRRWARILIFNQFYKMLLVVKECEIAVFKMKCGKILSKENASP